MIVSTFTKRYFFSIIKVMKDKKIIIIFILTAIFILLGIVGFTIAYFTSTTEFENEFESGLFQTEATEVFNSPSNWEPGDTTQKELTIENTGNVNARARVCLSEEWTSLNGDSLPNEVNNERVAILNLANTSDWTKRGNCYIYNDVLEPNDVTSTFINSVTFNPNIEADYTCETTSQGGTIEKTCESTGDGYDGASYALTFTVETIQESAYNDLWAPIRYVSRQNDNQISVGDEIAIKSEHFYVVSSDSNKIVALSKYNLLVGDVLTYHASYNIYSFVKTLTSNDEGYGLQSESARGLHLYNYNSYIASGVVAFSGTNYWDNSVCEYNGTVTCSGTEGLLSEYSQNGASYSGSTYPYVYRSDMNQYPPLASNSINYVQNNGYTIAYYVEEYENRLKELASIETISCRLLSIEENNLLSSDIKDLTSYWLGSANNSQQLYTVNSSDIRPNNSFDSIGHYGVRPTIEIPTSELE